MKTLFVISNNNQKNLYNQTFTTQALIQGTFDSWIYGTPAYYAHDKQSLLGWNFPTSVFFQSNLVTTISYIYIPEIEIYDDFEKIKNYSLLHQKNIIEIPNKEYLNELYDLLEDILDNKPIFFATNCVGFYQKDLVKRKYPQLFNEDDDFLVRINELDEISPGIFRKNEFILFAHKYFRKNYYFLNSLNTFFLEKLSFVSKENNSVKIALDPDMIGLYKTFKGRTWEYQYWRGPKFKNDLENIPNGVTVHQSLEDNANIEKTEFRWGFQDNKKVLEIEELVNFPISKEDEEYYNNRYIHSMVDYESKNIIHLDGAIRGYTEDKMIKRLDVDLAHTPRNTLYKKLWRIDGKIKISDWKELIANFYINNNLIEEYFNGGNKIEQLDITKELEKGVREEEKIVSYSIDKHSGLLFSLSFKNINNFNSIQNKDDINFIFDEILHEKEYIKISELIGIEFIKYLNRQYKTTKIENLLYVKFYDKYCNFPTIYIPKNKSIEIINLINQFLISFSNKYSDSLIAINMLLEIEDGIACIYSFYGHIENILDFFKTEFSNLPTSYNKLITWSEKISKYLGQKYKLTNFNPQNILIKEGGMKINREYLTYELEKRDKKTMFKLSLEDSKKIMQDESLSIAKSYLIKNLQCSKCQKNYIYCDCSYIFDSKISKKIISIIYTGLYITDKKI